MKKFLFTLAALLMAGSAFAWEQAGGNNPTGDYFYVNDIELTEAQVENGAYLTLAIQGHFDHYISAFRIMFEYPEGIAADDCEAGDGLELTYQKKNGSTASFTPSITFNDDYTNLLVQHSQQTFENGTSIGIAHYAPGDYEDMIYVYVDVPAGFQGGTVTMIAEPASGGYTGYPADNFVSAAQQITTFQITVPAGPVEPTPAPAPTINYDEATGLVTATCDGPNTVQLYLNGNPVDQPFDVNSVEQTWEAQTLTFTAVTQPGENETATESVEPVVVTIPALQPTPAPAPTIVVENGFVTAVCDGPNTVQLYLNGNPVDQPFELPAATEVDQVLTFTATTLPGEHEVATSTTEPTVVTIPAVVVPPTPTNTCARPECAYTITSLETVTVTITNNEPDATIFWTVVNQETGEVVDSGSFTGDQGEIIVSGVGKWEVHCYAHIDDPDWADSPDGGTFFEIMENDAPPVTAIDELVNGKTVAGVRYFNMAGQEMSEANGMTIVVTTYTDGTTSAVKVMK